MDCGRGNNLRGSDVLFPQCGSHSSCNEFKDHHRLAHIISTYRKCKQAAETGFLFHVSQMKPQKINTWLQMICVPSFLLALTFLSKMGTVGKEDDTQDYDADVFLPYKALWFFGLFLFWFMWLFLHLLQMFLWLIKGLLWFFFISVSSLCYSLSLLWSCVLLLPHYTCDAVYFATLCPVYVCIRFLSVGIALYNTRITDIISHVNSLQQ